MVLSRWMEELRRRGVLGTLLRLDRRRRPASPGAYLARRQRRRLLAFLAGSTGLGLLLAGGALHLHRQARRPFPGTPSIVVLPFANLSNDPGQDYFADGMTEEIQGALSQIPGLRVIGRTTSFALRDRAADLRDVGRRLGVTSVLEGSVRRAGSRLRVNAQVVDARDGYQLWSQTFDRDAGDVLAVQNEIGRAVAEALQVTLLPKQGRSPGAQPIDPEVYNQYLLARRFLGPSSLEGFVRAAAASQKAISLSPSFAPAWATLAAAYGGMADYDSDPQEIAADQRKAVAAAVRAIELDPALAEAYAARAQLLAQTTWDWEAAREDFDRALALAPGDADILRKKGAWLLAPQGRVPEAIDVLRRSTELDPLSASSWMTLGLLEVAASNGAAGERALLRAIEIDPDNDYAHQALGVRLLLVGNPAAALAQTNGCAPGLWRLRGAALAQHDLGHARESDTALSELTSQLAGPSPFQIAEVHAWRGEANQAFDWLERALAARDGGLLLITWDPLLAKVRGDPRMASLLGRMNLPPR